jgi:adenylate cyclase
LLTARLIELVLIAIQLLGLLLAVAIGLKVSIWAGVLFIVLFACVLLFVVYNYDYWLVRRLTSADDPLSVNLCKSGFMGRTRRTMRIFPANPRCRLCLVPFGGIGRLIGIKPSAKNPNFCRSCFEGLPTQTREMKVGVLFADIRGFTSWTEYHATVDAVRAVTEFYDIAGRVLTRDDAFMDYIGDQVMALYLTEMPTLGERTAEIMVAGAERLIKKIRMVEKSLPVGVGLNIGKVQIGALSKGESKGFTAIGDVVNTAARLQACAGEYEIVMSDDVYEALDRKPRNAKAVMLELKGKSAPQKAYVVAATR